MTARRRPLKIAKHVLGCFGGCEICERVVSDAVHLDGEKSNVCLLIQVRGRKLRMIACLTIIFKDVRGQCQAIDTWNDIMQVLNSAQVNNLMFDE